MTPRPPTLTCPCRRPVPARRAALGYTTCLPCGEKQAHLVKHTTLAMPKSNYVYVSPQALHLLKQANPKRQQEN